LVADSKRSRIVGDSPERSNNVAWHPTASSRHRAQARGCRSQGLPVHRPPPQSYPARTPRALRQAISSSTVTADQTVPPSACFPHAQAHSAFQFNSHQEQTNSQSRHNYSNIALRTTRNYCTTDQINNIICALLRLSFRNPAVSHMFINHSQLLCH